VELRRKTDPLFDDYFGREFWMIHAEIWPFETRIYSSVRGQAEIWGTDKVLSKDLRVSVGVERYWDLHLIENLRLFAAGDYTFYRSIGFSSPILETVGGLEYNALRCFAAFYNGADERGVFLFEHKRKLSIGMAIKM